MKYSQAMYLPFYCFLSAMMTCSSFHFPSPFKTAKNSSFSPYIKHDKKAKSFCQRLHFVPSISFERSNKISMKFILKKTLMSYSFQYKSAFLNPHFTRFSA